MKLNVSFEERPLDWFLDRLDLDGARLIGERDVLCRCPAHDDYSPSLHVWEDGQGLGVHCFAGCSRAEVEEALAGAAPVLTRVRSLPKFDPGRIVARYVYTDHLGNPRYRKLRYEPKSFQLQRAVHRRALTGPVYMDARIDWLPGLKDREGRFLVEPLPYRLPELLAAIKRGKPVWLTDGEKDANRLAEEGVVATCGPFGMGRWTFNDYLRGAREVVIVADRDEAGYRDAAAIAASIPYPVKVVAAAVGKDAFDHLEAGLGLDEFEEVA